MRVVHGARKVEQMLVYAQTRDTPFLVSVERSAVGTNAEHPTTARA